MIVRSILDTDLYKLTMRKAIARHYAGTPVRYEFINRRLTDTFDAAFVNELQSELDNMSTLALTDAEADWLNESCSYLGHDFVNSLRSFRYDPKQISLGLEDGQLRIGIEGPWEDSVLWEVPLMAVVCELFARRYDQANPMAAGWQERLTDGITEKAFTLCQKGVNWNDFGTRRRRSYEVQEQVVRIMSQYKGFQGTSNPYLAMKYDVKPRGTMAHEWIMGVSVLEGMRHANRHALNKWAETYHGDLGIALTDTFGTDAFWGDFDMSLAKLYDGVRHDSGHPFTFGDRAIAEYQKRKINPRGKTAVFSDGLNIDKVLEINARFRDRIGLLFGIGTHLTNDVEGRPAMNIVIKLVRCAGVPTVKLSDVPSKAMGDQDARRVAMWTFFGKALDDRP